jgi:hypothetical protein
LSGRLSKTNYVAVAKILAKHNRVTGPFGGFMLDQITKDLADYFQTNNPKFNRHLFELAVWEGQGSD